MQYRKLGRTQFNVSEIGFGSWGIGGGWGKTDDAAAIDALKLAFDSGVNFYDTALVYGDGHSEQLISKALKSVREQIIIATKIPPKTFRWPVRPNDPVNTTFPADWIIECTEKSLRNLNTDYIDVQQLHAWTPSYLQQTDWLEGFNKLKEMGKIKAFGVSANDWDPYGPTELIQSDFIDSVQVIYNIFEQRPAEKLLPAALAHHVGIIVRVPFEEGLLTGKFGPDHQFEEDDWRGNWLTAERLREANQRVERLKSFLNEERPTLAALALKYCLSHPAVSTVIPGMRRKKHVQENCAAADGKYLSAEDIKTLTAHQFVHGWNYPWS